MKTGEELNALKNEVEALNGKLAELCEDELTEVNGGTEPYYVIKPKFFSPLLRLNNGSVAAVPEIPKDHYENIILY